MHLFTHLLQVIIDALFPLTCVEDTLLHMSPSEALNSLNKAPPCPIPDTFAVFHYKDERVQKLIWNIKYKASKKAVEIAGYCLFHHIQKYISTHQRRHGDQIFVLIPIPITKKRRKERGYNQCELLLDEIERLYMRQRETTAGTRHPFQLLFEKNLLERTHHTSRQTLKNRSDRLRSAKNIFGLNEKVTEKICRTHGVDGVQIIILDDVITTGSTMREAQCAIKNAGFTEVIGISVAH